MADPEEQSDTASYQPTMDLSHFRQLIREAEKERLVPQERPRVKGATKSSASNVKHNGVFMLPSTCVDIILVLFVTCSVGVSVCTWLLPLL